MSERDYRRIRPLVDAILALPLDFQGDSAFASRSATLDLCLLIIDLYSVSKALTLFNIVVDSCWTCFYPISDKYMNLFLANANTGYADVSASVDI